MQTGSHLNTGQAKNWIYPKIGKTKLKDFTATDADKFFKELGGVLGKRSLVMIKSTLRRSIRRAQVHNLIGRNVVELIDDAWHASNLVFCHENGTMYTSDALNWRFSKMTRKAGIGHWHAHEGRHTAGSIMSSNRVPIQDQRHGRPQVHPRHRDRLPPRDRPRHPRRSDRHGRRVRR